MPMHMRGYSLELIFLSINLYIFVVYDCRYKLCVTTFTKVPVNKCNQLSILETLSSLVNNFP